MNYEEPSTELLLEERRVPRDRAPHELELQDRGTNQKKMTTTVQADHQLRSHKAHKQSKEEKQKQTSAMEVTPDGETKPQNSNENELESKTPDGNADEEDDDPSIVHEKGQNEQEFLQDHGIEREEVIMTKHEYDQVQDEYEVVRREQQRCGYQTRKYFSENYVFRFFCCCLRVKDRLELSWDELTPLQKKHRIKTYWKKARRVFLFQRLKLADEKFKKNKDLNQMDDGDDILENINNSQEQDWKWYIIR